MPYSSVSGKALVDRAITRLVRHHPDFFTTKHIIDIGAGSGTYSDRYAKTWLPRPDFKWTGIEIWEPYLEKFKLEDKYDDVLVLDALEYLMATVDRADICFLGDVIEHMTKEHAKSVISAALHVSKLVIVSIPIGHYPQDEYEGNPHERHITDNWSMKEAFDFLPNVKFYAQDQEIGVFMCANDAALFPILAPKVGVYGICKDELANVNRFMASVIEADAVVICDTGSTDGTYQRFIEHQHDSTHPFGMKVASIHVRPWRFDDARNCALLLLPESLDACISLDLDEQLDPGWYKTVIDQLTKDLQTNGKIFDRYNHRFRSHWNWDKTDEPAHVSEHWHERIHARKGFMWKLPVHEVLVKSDGSNETVSWMPTVWMTQRPDLSKPRSSYLGMLEISVKEDPTRWKSWAFLAGEYSGAGRTADAIAALNTARNLPDADKGHLSIQIANVHRHANEPNKAIYEMFNAIDASPTLREYRVYLAETYLGLGRNAEALAVLEEAAKITGRSTGYSYNPQCWDKPFDDLMASTIAKVGR